MSPKHRRGPGEGHIKRITLKSGRTAWRGWLTVGYRENGTPIRRTAQGRTRERVAEKLIQLREKYRADLDLVAETEMRCSQLFAKWLAHFVATNRPKRRTPETYRWAWNRAEGKLGDPLAARVSPMQLQELLNSFVGELKPKSIGLIRIVLDGMFGQAVLWRVRPDNPAAELKTPRDVDGEPDERRILSADESQRFVAALQAERLGLAVALTYAVAIRPSEAAALRVQDIDLEAGTVTIAGAHNISRETKTIERDTPKSKRGRRVLPLPHEIIPWVRRQITRVYNERQAMGALWSEPDEGLIFVRSSDGGRLSSHQLYHVARKVAEAAGLGKVSPRILRRSMLSQLAAAGVDAKVRAAIGGHTKDMTEQHYREVSPAEVDAAISHVAALLPPLQTKKEAQK